jgi:uncharacterized protein YbjT (DUF2867 family)
MVKSLLETGKHTVTALTRADSTNTLPSGVNTKTIDYSKPETIVDALKGQQVLIITLSVFSPPGTELTLIDAAQKAGVQWVLPNAWGSDTTNKELVKDVFGFQGKEKITDAIVEKGMNYISVATSFWYEWSLAFQAGYGFDIPKKNVIFFDEGTVKINTSTWPQVGRAVAGLLSLPIKPEGGNEEKSLENFKNKIVYVKSFLLSQKDMFDAILRVTGDKESDWTITHVPSKERYAEGIKKMQNGDRSGFAESMYTRVFYPDGCGNFEHQGLSNGLLELPEEDLDEATKAAVEKSKVFKWK